MSSQQAAATQNLKTRKSHHIGTLSPEMALLGLLYGQPGYGYDLHRKVINELGQVWHLSQSQAYLILKRLEAQRDISSIEISQEKLPARQLLQITEQGCARFLDWLAATSGGSVRAMRMEFVTRLYFINQYFPERLIQIFEDQKAEAQTHIQRLAKTHAELPTNQIHNRMSLDLRLRQLQCVMEWLEENQKTFQGG